MKMNLEVARIIFYSVISYCLIFMIVDDWRNPSRCLVWAAFLVEHLAVLVLLAIDNVQVGTWVANRWILTPVSGAVAIVCFLEIRRRIGAFGWLYRFRVLRSTRNAFKLALHIWR
jgi:hypothetical protein